MRIENNMVNNYINPKPINQVEKSENPAKVENENSREDIREDANIGSRIDITA